MKICYINPTNNLRRPIAELSLLLSEKWHKISIMYPVSEKCPTKNWKANEAIENSQIKKIKVDAWYFAPLRYSIPNFFELLKTVKKAFKENDVIHIWEYYYPLSVWMLIYGLFSGQRRKIILTTDGFVGYSYRPKEPWWLNGAFRIYTQLFARFLFKIPLIMTTYGKAMLPYAKKTGVKIKKIRIISTGIHLERFTTPNLEKIKALKKEFGIKDEKIILFVGMLTKRKRPEIVIRMGERLISEGYNLKIILVGAAHRENIYKKMVNGNFKDNFIFTGNRCEISEFMHMSDVLLLPSVGEGLPGVVMEAMACSLPVVATKEGCTPDLIESGREGLLVKGSEENYYKAVKEVLDDPELAERIRKEGLKKIKKFSWGKVAKKYEELYF